MKAVIALGGNAILRKGDKGTVREQWDNINKAAIKLSEAIKENDEIVITHGNGPQVGLIMEMVQSLKLGDQLSLDIADAMTEGWIGYMLQHSLSLLNKKVATILTRTVVLKDDPAFLKPTKYIGSYYTKEEAEKLSKEYGWSFREDPRGGYRRVVPSPMPVDILEIELIKKLIEEKYLVIAVGGGGIPVIRDRDRYVPVEAVIDKDLASSLLGIKINAEEFVILTDVKGVALNYGTKDQVFLDRIKVNELRDLYNKKVFPEGSMGPKVLAAIKFVESTKGKAVIGELDDAYNVIKGISGTVVMP